MNANLFYALLGVASLTVAACGGAVEPVPGNGVTPTPAPTSTGPIGSTPPSTVDGGITPPSGCNCPVASLFCNCLGDASTQPQPFDGGDYDTGIPTDGGWVCACPAGEPNCSCASSDGGVLVPGQVCQADGLGCFSDTDCCSESCNPDTFTCNPGGVGAIDAGPPPWCGCPANDPDCACSNADAGLDAWVSPPICACPINDPACGCDGGIYN